MEMGVPPDSDEFEFTLIGPGYGESIILHLGGGVWVLVDSNVDKDGNPGSQHPNRWRSWLPHAAVCRIAAMVRPLRRRRLRFGICSPGHRISS